MLADGPLRPPGQLRLLDFRLGMKRLRGGQAGGRAGERGWWGAGGPAGGGARRGARGGGGPGGGGGGPGGDATRCVLVNGGKQIEMEMPPDAFW